MDVKIPDLAGISVMVVEDDLMLRKGLSAFLRSHEMEVEAAANLATARHLAKQQVWDIVLLDVCLPDGNGLDFLAEGLVSDTTAAIIMTATGGMDTVITALRLGAADYLAKPFDMEELPFIFERIWKQKRINRQEHFRRSQQLTNGFMVEGLGEKWLAHLQDILDADHRLKNHLPPILLEGETGTGKSSLARWIHSQGPRAEGPLIEVNCSTLPDALAESELFGHEKGAFTDAKDARMGLFEAAHGGTLFLDEVTSLSAAVQAKVLTAIEDGTIRRVGGLRSIKVDVRLIAAALPDLEQRVSDGRFREDLYHRMNLLRLRLPPLRERTQAILPIAEFLLEQLRIRYGQKQAVLSTISRQRLVQHNWPGNVRELRHVLERAFIFNKGTELDVMPQGAKEIIGTATSNELLNPNWSLPSERFEFEPALHTLTMQVIQMALKQTGDNVSAAARMLGVPRDFIRYRLDSDQ